MFIQLLASGTSQQNSSVCKFNLWAITSNRRLFCRRDSGACQSACPYGLTGILSKHKGMMGELWSKCPCPIILRIPASNHWFMTILMLPLLCMQTNHLLDYVHAHFVFITLSLSISLHQYSVRSFLLSDSCSICCGKPQIYWAGWTAEQQNSSLKNTAPSLTATDFYSELNKRFRNEGMCAFVPASCSLSSGYMYYACTVLCTVKVLRAAAISP